MSAEPTYQQWHHSPSHLFIPGAFYIVTAGTLDKAPIFSGTERLRLLNDTLLSLSEQYKWRIQAWAVFSNHYHFIAEAPDDAMSLRTMIRHLHSVTARSVNLLDKIEGRRVWFQYRDTCLTHQVSYLARLKYVHNNAVHHGIVCDAEAYPFCSAAWFANNAPDSFRRTLSTFKTDRVNVPDEFDVVWKE